VTQERKREARAQFHRSILAHVQTRASRFRLMGELSGVTSNSPDSPAMATAP
jgi:hypothetical protein